MFRTGNRRLEMRISGKSSHIYLLRGAELKILESGNKNAATFSIDHFYQNSNIYVIFCVYRKSKDMIFEKLSK